MTQLTKDQPTQHLQPCPTCADCPMFNNFDDARNRGWCQAFEKMARTHHPRTNICDLTIKQQTEQKAVEVSVTLYSHELEIDEEEGFTYPKEKRFISFFVPEVTEKAVQQAFQPHQHEFEGFYIAYFNRCYKDAEF